MYRTILLAAALQHWDRYSAHALAAREVAGTMAIGATHHLHVLSVYDYNFKAPASGLPAEMVAKLREDDLRQYQQSDGAKSRGLYRATQSGRVRGDDLPPRGRPTQRHCADSRRAQG